MQVATFRLVFVLLALCFFSRQYLFTLAAGLGGEKDAFARPSSALPVNAQPFFDHADRVRGMCSKINISFSLCLLIRFVSCTAIAKKSEFLTHLCLLNTLITISNLHEYVTRVPLSALNSDLASGSSDVETVGWCAGGFASRAAPDGLVLNPQIAALGCSTAFPCTLGSSAEASCFSRCQKTKAMCRANGENFFECIWAQLETLCRIKCFDNQSNAVNCFVLRTSEDFTSSRRSALTSRSSDALRGFRFVQTFRERLDAKSATDTTISFKKKISSVEIDQDSAVASSRRRRVLLSQNPTDVIMLEKRMAEYAEMRFVWGVGDATPPPHLTTAAYLGEMKIPGFPDQRQQEKSRIREGHALAGAAAAGTAMAALWVIRGSRRRKHMALRDLSYSTTSTVVTNESFSLESDSRSGSECEFCDVEWSGVSQKPIKVADPPKREVPNVSEAYFGLCREPLSNPVRSFPVKEKSICYDDSFVSDSDLTESDDVSIDFSIPKSYPYITQHVIPNGPYRGCVVLCGLKPLSVA